MAVPQSPSPQAQISTDRLSKILEEDEENKKKLVLIYDDVKLLLSNESDATLEAEIAAQYKDYQTQLDNYPKELTEDERPIVVTGETSSGKSSVLNILLGFNVFPTLTLPSTGVICRLRTSETKKADVIDFNEKIVQTIKMEGDDEEKFTHDLSGYISPEENRDEHQIKYVDIYWPIPFLRKNVIVVDTPGIGESEEMTERLVRYLPKAVALIYVIDPTHAGGIAKDRIVPLFKAIQGEDKNGMRQAFDPSCAMFLCNKWDLVGKNEQNKVLGFIRNKLTMYWPNIQEKQIYIFSAKKTWNEMSNQENLPEDYIHFRKGIEELIEVSLCAKSRQHQVWLETFLIDIRTSLRSHLIYITLSESLRMRTMNRGMKLIKMLEDRRDTSKAKLQKEAAGDCAKLAKKLNSHIHDENNREIMFPWNKVTLPDKGNDLREIRREAEKLIHSLIMDELNRCLHIYGGIQIQEKLIKAVQKEADDIRKLRFLLEKILHSPEEANVQETEKLDDNFQSKDNDGTEWNKGRIAVASLTSPLWFPLALAGGLIGIPLLLASMTIKDKIQVSQYKSNKQQYIDKWSRKYVCKITEQMVHAWLKKTVFETFFEHLHDLFDRELPQIVAGCKRLLQNLDNEVRSADSIRQHYQPKLKDCNRLLGKLSSSF